MKNIFKFSIVAILILSFASADAQYVLDGVYQKEHTVKRRVIPYAPLREADVMWNKRMWRRIDLRQKINFPLYYPTSEINDRQSMFDVIKDALVQDGTITAYDVGPIGADDEFTLPMTVDQVKSILFSVDTSWTEDLETGEYVPVVQNIEMTTDMIKWYDIKEEWFFDRQRSVMDVRIIGICPMKEKRNDEGEYVGLKPLFWIYFYPALKEYLLWDR